MARKFASHKVFKRNVRKRLRQLKVTPYQVSKAAKRGKSWLSDILLDGRYPDSIGSGIVDAAASALGVTPSALIDPKFVAAEHRRPTWLK
jgi:hypothetical protein